MTGKTGVNISYTTCFGKAGGSLALMLILEAIFTVLITCAILRLFMSEPMGISGKNTGILVDLTKTFVGLFALGRLG